MAPEASADTTSDASTTEDGAVIGSPEATPSDSGHSSPDAASAGAEPTDPQRKSNADGRAALAQQAETKPFIATIAADEPSAVETRAVVAAVTAAADSESLTAQAAPQAEADSPAPATAAALPPPSALAVLVDDLIANVARFLGYAPAAGSGPVGLPPLRSLLEEVFAAIRRPFFGGMPNQAPSANPVQLHEFLSGEVVGDLLPFDLNGDSLTYAVSQGPIHGDVIVNPNGTYVYVPDRDFATSGGTDTFVVTIDDNRLLPGQTGTGVISVPVTVTVAPAPGRSRGYNIDNLTTSKVSIANIWGDTGDYSGPPVGFTLNPATRIDFQVDEYAFVYSYVHMSLTSADGSVAYGVSMKVPPSTAAAGPQAKCSSNGGACNPSATDYSKVQSVRLLEKDVKTIEKNADVDTDAQQIADLLKTYCADGSVASCSFKTTRQDDHAVGMRHQVGNALLNPSSVAQSTQVTVSDTQTETDSVSIAAKLSGGVLTKLASIINVEITATYGHTWTNSHTFTQSVTMNVPANSIGILYAAQPVYRAWGDFTVKVGNTTYVLKNVYFDTPRTDGKAPGGTYITDVKPITAESLSQLPPGTTIVVLGDPTAIDDEVLV